MSKEKFERAKIDALLRRQRLPVPIQPPSATATSTSDTATTSSTTTSTTPTSTGTTTGTSTTSTSTGTASSTGTVSSSSTTGLPSTSSSSTPPTSTTATLPVTTSQTQQSTSTFIVTESTTSSNPLVPTSSVNTLGPTITPTRDTTQTGFFHDKGAVAGTFTAVGIVAAILIVLFATTCIRRRQAKRFDEDVAAAAAAAYRDADGYWEREDNWNNNVAPASSGYTSSAYTDGTHGAYNEPAMAVPQGDYQNYGEGGGYSANNYNNGGYQGGGPGYAVGSEAYGMNNLPPNVHHGPSYGSPGIAPAALAAGAAGVGAGAYAAHGRQRSPPPPSHNGLYQGYADMGMNDSLDGGRYPVPPARSRSLNQGSQGSPAASRPLSNSSSGHSHGSYPYPYQQNNNSGSPPTVKPTVGRSGSKGPTQGYSQNYGAPLPQMQEHHNEGDAYGGLSPDTDYIGQQEHDEDLGEVEDMPRVLRVANE